MSPSYIVVTVILYYSPLFNENLVILHSSILTRIIPVLDLKFERSTSLFHAASPCSTHIYTVVSVTLQVYLDALFVMFYVYARFGNICTCYNTHL